MKYYLTYLLVFILMGCAESSIEPEEVSKPGCESLIINGTRESFCTYSVGDVSSELVTTDSLYIYSQNSSFYLDSENYKASFIGFANYIPDSSEFDFFYNMISLMSPESYHDLDITKPGGFAIEVWDYSGEYYSSELGPQTKGGQIIIYNTTTYMAGPEMNQVSPYMTLWFGTTSPIVLWNSDKTKSLEVEFNRTDYFVIFPN